MTPNSDLQFIHKESGNSMTTAKLQSARLLPHWHQSRLSSMKDEEQIHTGRPFGGVVVLWRKKLNRYCSIITYDCDRILGLQFTCGSFTALFLCAYFTIRLLR